VVAYADNLDERRTTRRLARRSAIVGAVAMILLVFAPWGHLTVSILGVRSPGLGFNGTQISTGVAGIPWGWLLLAAGAVTVLAVLSDGVALARLSACAAAAIAVANVATVHSNTVSATAGNGQQLDSLLQPVVTAAWGSYAELLAAAITLFAVARARR
jgi:hypothetical protein